MFKKIATLSLCLSLTYGQAFAADTLSKKEAETLATEAYVYGFPLVLMEMSRRVMTNTVKPVESGGKLMAPMGQFCNVRTYPTAAFKDVVSPNADTLYSTAWLDLKAEPYVFEFPAEGDRYYLFPMLDAWTNIFVSPGQRTTGGDAQKYLITGPGWQGDVPDGLTQVAAPTNLIWILGRTYSSGTPEDFKTVNQMQNQYQLTPLSSYGKGQAPKPGVVDHKVDMKTPVIEQMKKMDAATFYGILAQMMKDNPADPEDQEMTDKLAKLGIVAGQPFNMHKAPAVVQAALKASPKTGLMQISGAAHQAGAQVNGWQFLTIAGKYDKNYLVRAFVALVGLGANLSADAIYPRTTMDNQGKPLSGDHAYVIHLDKDSMPPVTGFWSLTMYNTKDFFVDNPLNRYNLSSHANLKTNADGSIDLYIQHKNPGKDKEANWLPAPKGNFNLLFRFYWPEQALLDGTWKIPPVMKVK
jgi:hypothetical protein